MRVAVISHALPVYKKNRIASLPSIFETIVVYVFVSAFVITNPNFKRPIISI